jgi:hypothetical protein
MGAKSEVSPTPVLSKTGWPLGVWAAIGKVMPAAASRVPELGCVHAWKNS